VCDMFVRDQVFVKVKRRKKDGCGEKLNCDVGLTPSWLSCQGALAQVWLNRIALYWSNCLGLYSSILMGHQIWVAPEGLAIQQGSSLQLVEVESVDS
jgi:hypothetical protein